MLGLLGRRRAGPVRSAVEGTSRWVDDRMQVATPLRRLINKVFPDHWSFMLGEIALYSFIMLLLTGTFLGLFFDPSMAETHYSGPYTPLQGVAMSEAYRSTLDLSFTIRGGLFIRQLHHWAANLFMAAIIVHMLRIFFTGVFRRPREINWVIGLLLFWLGFLEGFMGYSLPDDGLSGTGLRIAYSIVLSIPIVGTWVASSLFNGEFPGEVIIGRFYFLHVFVVPAIIVALIAVHLALIVKQKHTQWHRPGYTRRNVVGTRMVPGFALSSIGLNMLVFSMLALLSGIFQINPVWLWGPYEAADVTSGAQPDWYVWFLEGALRVFPDWAIREGYTVPQPFWPAVVLPGILTTLAVLYPWLERRKTGDRGDHQLAQRPRDAPGRTALGVMAFAFFTVLSLSGINDIIADKFSISLNATTWAGRIGLLIVPPIAYAFAYRLALALQQHDREVLAHGMETGVIRRDGTGRYVEIHQPLAEVNEHGHSTLTYANWVVPKKPNRVGVLRGAIRGFFFPIEARPTRPDGAIGGPGPDGSGPAEPDGGPNPAGPAGPTPATTASGGKPGGTSARRDG